MGRFFHSRPIPEKALGSASKLPLVCQMSDGVAPRHLPKRAYLFGSDFATWFQQLKIDGSFCIKNRFMLNCLNQRIT